MPNVTMQPALDEVQQGLNRAAQTVLGTFKGVIQWGQRQCKLKIGAKKDKKKKRSPGDEALQSKSIVRSGKDSILATLPFNEQNYFNATSRLN